MKFLRLSLCLLSATILLGSCVKKTYDSPPDASQVDPNLAVNCQISTLTSEALDYTSNAQTRILGDSIISGVVTADDRSGNFYKQIIIQDAGGAIVLIIDKTFLYADFPIGRKVYVKTKGLYLVNYNGTPELVFNVTTNGSTTATSGIPSALISNFIVKGSFPNPVTPVNVSISDLYSGASQYYNRLITIDDMQFTDDSKGRTYAAPVSSGSFSTSLNVTDCSHTVSKIIMYNSSYSTFQPAITPTGNGKLTVICSNYKNTIQLLLRDTTDVHFTGPRCP